MKIKINNQWESLEWLIGKNNVTNKLNYVILKFPDGTTHDFKVTWKQHSQSYSDMGHTYYASQYNAFIVLEVNGIKLKTNLGDIAKKVDVVDYTVRKTRRSK